MAKKFSDLVAKLPPERRAAADAMASELMTEVALDDLLRARGSSRADLAGLLDVKREHRSDMYISTLRTHIKAMGGELELIAHFPDGDVKIASF
jgi:hypothetical protein